MIAIACIGKKVHKEPKDDILDDSSAITAPLEYTTDKKGDLGLSDTKHINVGASGEKVTFTDYEEKNQEFLKRD